MVKQARAYSYIRFSTAQQAEGDSVRRQTKLSERYAHKHGLELDKKLTFRDLGTSAFRGKNLRQGELGDFIKLVRSGRIKAGSFLLVENLDRVSRGEPLEAFDLLRQLIQLGITVVTLSP